MNKVGIILLLWGCCAISVFADTVSADSLTLDSVPTAEAINLAELHALSVHHRSDVRHMRDSLKQNMRMVRKSMHHDVQRIRDSVRHDLQEVTRKYPHQVRIGWGDQLFESLVWYNQSHSTHYPETYIGQYDEQYRYLQHWFAEYQYRVRYWFNVGGMLDYSGVVWDRVSRNGKGEEISRDKNCNFHNIAILATTRFTYMHSKYVELYSGLGAGVNINTGSELDYRDRKTAVAPVFSLTVLGMSVGNEQWFGSVEFGGLYSLMNIQEVYMAGSRMFTLSVGYRF